MEGEEILMLRFIEDSHTYLWNGNPVPSVTQILREWVEAQGTDYHVNTLSGALVPSYRLEAARETGTAIHKGARFILEGKGVNWERLAPELVGPLRQLEKWMKDFRVKPVFVEEPMYSEELGVAGTPDLICHLNGDESYLALPDIKTGLLNEMVGPQTAAYESIVRKYKGVRKIVKRFELILPRDGSPYRFNPLTNNQDFAFFLSRHFQYRYLNAA